MHQLADTLSHLFPLIYNSFNTRILTSVLPRTFFINLDAILKLLLWQFCYLLQIANEILRQNERVISHPYGHAIVIFNLLFFFFSAPPDSWSAFQHNDFYARAVRSGSNHVNMADTFFGFDTQLPVSFAYLSTFSLDI